MGFEPQLARILACVRPDRQLVMFSATFPGHVEARARASLRHAPVELIVGGRSKASPAIAQWVEVRAERDKFPRLLQLLGEWYETGGGILVFVDTQEHCDTLWAELHRRGYPAGALHGGKEQVDRDQTLADFKGAALGLNASGGGAALTVARALAPGATLVTYGTASRRTRRGRARGRRVSVADKGRTRDLRECAGESAAVRRRRREKKGGRGAGRGGSGARRCHARRGAAAEGDGVRGRDNRRRDALVAAVAARPSKQAERITACERSVGGCGWEKEGGDSHSAQRHVARKERRRPRGKRGQRRCCSRRNTHVGR
jgi:hypothetical protein